jgi:hypothetical protein
MTRVVLVPAKRSDATVPVEFPFADQLEFGETIAGQVVTCQVFTGDDSAPENVLSGPPTLSDTTVSQIVTGGVPGVIYQLVAIVTTSNSNMYTKGARLAIVDEPAAFYATP